MTRDHAFNTLRRVREEFEAGRFAIGHVIAEWGNSRLIANRASRSGFTRAELRRCAAHLEITFALRLFCEFEGILRDYWVNGLNRHSEPPIFDLMESIARRRRMSAADIALAHEVRWYRNEVTHESLRDVRYDFPSCLRALGRYMRWLPLNW